MNPLRAFDRLKGLASRRVMDAWLAFSMAGLCLTAASYYLGLGIVPFHGRLLSGHDVAGYGLEKEVGYVAALNWSFCGAVVVPALVVCSLKMHAAMEPTLRRLASQSMARTTTDLKVVTPDELVARWKHDRSVGLFIPALAGAVAFAVIMLGWITEVALPSIWGISSADMLRIGSSAEEYDWSIACLMNNGGHVAGGCAGSLAFSLLAYLLIPGFSTAYAFACMIDAGRFVAFACGETKSQEGSQSDESTAPSDWVLVASPRRSGDLRCGFGAFEPFVTPFFGTVACVLLSLFLVVTQNAYLRDPNSRNILDFFSQDLISVVAVIAEVTQNKIGVSTAVGQIFSSDKGLSLFNPKTIFSIFIFFFVVTLCLSAIMMMLTRTAARARERALEHAAELAVETGQSEGDVRDRLDAMTLWPLSWISLRTTITVIVFISLALLSFRLALGPTLIGAVLLVAAYWRRRRTKPASAPAQTRSTRIKVPAAVEPPPTAPRPASLRLLISYRRTDTEAIAGRIRDNIAMHFGEESVFMDIDSIPFGFDFRDQISLALKRVDIVLVIMGQNWVGELRDGRPRIWDERDPVRFEVEMSLKQAIPVIPVLVQGAQMPAPDDLPSTLRDFSFRNAIAVDSGRDFRTHLDRLIRALEYSLANQAGRGNQPAGDGQSPSPR